MFFSIIALFGREGEILIGFSRSLIVYREVDKKKVLAKAEVWMRKVQVNYYF